MSPCRGWKVPTTPSSQTRGLIYSSTTPTAADCPALFRAASTCACFPRVKPTASRATKCSPRTRLTRNDGLPDCGGARPRWSIRAVEPMARPHQNRNTSSSTEGRYSGRWRGQSFQTPGPASQGLPSSAMATRQSLGNAPCRQHRPGANRRTYEKCCIGEPRRRASIFILGFHNPTCALSIAAPRSIGTPPVTAIRQKIIRLARSTSA